MRSFLPFATLLLLMLGITPAAADDPPHGLNEQQWQHVLDGNEGRAEELHIGDVAPEFELPSLDGESMTKLSSFRDERPVILFFGSYT